MKLRELIEENNTMRFYHGVNLDSNEDNINHKPGRF